MSNIAFFIVLFTCLGSAAIVTVLHFQMKFRLNAAALPVKWFMTPIDDWRMWKTYRSEAATKSWPVWPFYAYKTFQVLFVVSAIVLLFNSDKLGRLLGQ